LNLINNLEETPEIKKKFSLIEEISYFNHQKVLRSFQENKVASEHFFESTGYGHDDLGRKVLDQVFSSIFQTERSLVRSSFASGTHAISCCILGNLSFNQSVLFLGRPYDTLEPVLEKIKTKLNVDVIIFEPENWEIKNLCQELKNFLELRGKAKKELELICFQRSRGYSERRPSLRIQDLKELIVLIKKKLKLKSEIFVDNCYGEFVETEEISQFGASLIAGSLIKNPGGGIVNSGAYLTGKSNLVKKAASELTAAGICESGGVCFGQKRLLFQGIYLAPMITKEILKSMTLAARVFQELNLKTEPTPEETRTDIIQRVDLGNKEKMLKFCKLLQALSPIDSHLTPVPGYSPGYKSQIIMASGTFIQGATSELSADGPLRSPFSIYLQGGLSYLYTKIFLEKLLQAF